MTDADSVEFIKALAVLGEVFNETVSDVRIEAYFAVLRDHPIEAVTAACQTALKRCKFFPRPAELREFMEGSTEDRAALAWAAVMRAIVEVGCYESVDFGDRAIHGVIEAMGGWAAEAWQLERLDARDLGFREAEFRRLYRALSLRPESGPARLVGIHEAENRLTGHVVPVTTLKLGVGQRALPARATEVAAQ